MSDLTPFRFDSHAVRVIDVAGSPWFVAKDAALALDYVWNGMDCIRHVPEKWRGVRSVLTPYGAQEMAVLSEQGLYFFVCRSDKPKALPFQEWLAGDVLPAIRRTGAYRIDAGATGRSPLQADLARIRAQNVALWSWLIEIKPEIGKIARYKKLGLNHVEIGLLTARRLRNVRRNVRRIEACGLLPKCDSAQLSLLEG